MVRDGHPLKSPLEAKVAPNVNNYATVSENGDPGHHTQMKKSYLWTAGNSLEVQTIAKRYKENIKQ